MSKVVVEDHHHDEDAGIYRLVFAYMDENDVTYMAEEIVWDAKDERWQGKNQEAIAKEQRQIVSDMLAERQAARDKEQQARAAATSLGGVGEEL